MENVANISWLQVGTLFVGMLGLGLASLVYLTRQFNRLADRVGNLEQGQVRLEGRFNHMEERTDERFNRLEERTDERFDRLEERTDERFNHMEERTNERFNRLEEDLSQLRDEVSQLRDEVRSLGEGLQNVEKEQARMLGFLEGRGVMGKMPGPDAEAVP